VAVVSRSSGKPALLGREQPRVFTPPLRELTPETSLGFEVAEFARVVLDIELYPWQKWCLVHALELREDGMFRFRKVFVLVGRQNGKSLVLLVLTLWRMYIDGARRVLGTAQDRGIARKQFLDTVEVAESVADLVAEFNGDPVKTRGFEHFVLRGGETYQIAASNRRAGRSQTIDLALMDELREQQTWDTWSAVSKTTNARPNGQLWGVSNAGDASSVVLRHFRKVAHLALGDPDGLSLDPISGKTIAPLLPDEAGEVEDDTLGIFEWSAHPGCSIWDRDGWAQSNPSLGYGGITERTLASDAASDPEWVFRTEVLCQWFDGAVDGPFPPGAWQQGIDDTSKLAKRSKVTACIDVSWDRSLAHVAFAGRRKDGRIHVEIVASRAGTDWVVPWLASKDRTRQYMAVTYQERGAPVSSLSTALADSGLPVVTWSGTELARGTGQFYDLVRRVIGTDADHGWSDPVLMHRSQPLLDVPAATAVTKPMGDAWLWDRAKSPVDVAPLIAATGAVWALLREDELKASESAYTDLDLAFA